VSGQGSWSGVRGGRGDGFSNSKCWFSEVGPERKKGQEGFMSFSTDWSVNEKLEAGEKGGKVESGKISEDVKSKDRRGGGKKDYRGLKGRKNLEGTRLCLKNSRKNDGK